MSIEKLIGKKLQVDLIETDGGFSGQVISDHKGKPLEEPLEVIMGRDDNGKYTYTGGLKQGIQTVILTQYDPQAQMGWAEMPKTSLAQISNKLIEITNNIQTYSTIEEINQIEKETHSIITSFTPIDEKEKKKIANQEQELNSIMQRARKIISTKEILNPKIWLEEMVLETGTQDNISEVEKLSKDFMQKVVKIDTYKTSPENHKDLYEEPKQTIIGKIRGQIVAMTHFVRVDEAIPNGDHVNQYGIISLDPIYSNIFLQKIKEKYQRRILVKLYLKNIRPDMYISFGFRRAKEEEERLRHDFGKEDRLYEFISKTEEQKNLETKTE